MNLRLPAVIAVVAVAGTAAAARSLHPASPQPKSPFETADAGGPVRRVALERPRAASPPQLVVYVAGAVTRGGVYHLAPTARADDAVRAAGGATATADLVAVNLAARLSDGDEVVVPEKGAENDAAAGAPAAATTAHHKRKRHKKKHKKHRRTAAVSASGSDVSDASDASDTNSTADDAAPAAPVDLNSADASALETLPGIGSGLAERIVTFRELNGPFAAADDLLDVGGMTQKRLDAIAPYLTL